MKKRIVPFLLSALICLSALSGCAMFDTANRGEQSQMTDDATTELRNTDESTEDSPDMQASGVNLIPNVRIEGFTEFLDNENFVESVSHEDFIAQLGKYRYEGEKLTDFLPASSYVTKSGKGRGYSAGHNLFHYKSGLSVKKGIRKDFHQFDTYVSLDGLTLPYELHLGIALTEAFQKIGIEMDPYKDFVADENTDAVMTLFRDEKLMLIYYDFLRTKEPVDYSLPYMLSFRQNYVSTAEDGQPKTVVRTVRLWFGGFKNKLRHVEVSVDEEYAVKLSGDEFVVTALETLPEGLVTEKDMFYGTDANGDIWRIIWDGTFDIEGGKAYLVLADEDTVHSYPKDGTHLLQYRADAITVAPTNAYFLEAFGATSYIAEALRETYYAGETVSVKLETVTEHYYTLTVNGEDVPMDRYRSDMEYTYFTFFMPESYARVEIEEHWVDVPEAP